MLETAQHKKNLLNGMVLEPNEIKPVLDYESALMYTKVQTIISEFDRLSKLKPDATRLYILYAYFTLLVLNHKDETKKLVYKIQAIKEDITKRDRVKTSDKTMPKGFIVISIEPYKVGLISQVDQYALNLLNYSREDIMGKPLSLILPEHLIDYHQQQLNKFIFKAESDNVIDKRRLRFYIDSSNALVPVYQIVKFSFDPVRGIDLVGLLYSFAHTERFEMRSKLRYFMTYNQATGDIGYVCKNSMAYLGFL